MTIAISILILVLLWLAVLIAGHGYANTVDHISFRLHCHAKAMREMHMRRAAVVQERWMRDQRGAGEDAERPAVGNAERRRREALRRDSAQRPATTAGVPHVPQAML